MSDERVVLMPRLADTLVEGTLARWLKGVGDTVQIGEPLAALETDKVSTDLPAPASGTVLELLVENGRTVPVDTPLARIGTHSATPSRDDREPTPPVKPTPVAARLLAEHGLEASDLRQSGRVTKTDVLDHLAARSSSQDSAQPLSSMRRAIAAHMTRSAANIRHGSAVMAADLTAVAAWRDTHKSAFAAAHDGAALTFTVLFVHALASAVAERTSAAVHLGVAVAVDGGVLVPVVRDANSLSIAQTATHLADLARRARSNELVPTDMQGATLTLTNVGSFGNLTASPLIPVGQDGIMAPGLLTPYAFATAHGGITQGLRSLVAFVFDRERFADLEAEQLLSRFIAFLSTTPTL